MKFISMMFLYTRRELKLSNETKKKKKKTNNH
jgi:hypothetical protein